MESDLHDRDRVGVQDAVLLENYTDDKAFIENLQKRFNEDVIYTYIGPVLVSVNPYKELDIYSPKDVKAYKKRHFFEVPPHVFAVTDTAYRSLKEENREQCILISGESGSGKTEASKKVLYYIAEITDHKGEIEKVKEKLLVSNPVLEAFGNAKTIRNDNSSRFGKFMDVEFNFEGNPIGGIILNFLLEKSRVIRQAPGEKNFHIFYQLLNQASNEELHALHLTRDQGAFSYLHHTHGSDNHPFENFDDVKSALKTLEFSDNESHDMFSVVAGVLHLGNVKFSRNDEKLEIQNLDVIDTVAKVLKCDPHQLKLSLLQRTIETSRDLVTTPLDEELAIYARDALAKAIYDRMFTWLVQKINSTLQSKDARRKSVMGILDIYGFEIFEKNTFEQLCINFCNEKLQQLFIELTLKTEQEEYEKEGITWEHISYFDNQVICDLIEGKHRGLISFIDEECLRPGEPNDFTLLAKLNKRFNYHAHYYGHDKADFKTRKTMGRDEFCLIHYAGPVTYNVNSFIEKNNDLLFRDLREAMCTSDNVVIKETFMNKNRNSKKMPVTAITQFKNSLSNLINTLKDKEPSYIRCIKPNDLKRPGQFDNTIVQNQVKYLGLMENLRVKRAGFAYRREYELFLKRYKPLCKDTWPNWYGNAKDGVQHIVWALAYEQEEYQMGRTKIFIRHPQTLFRTEDALQVKKHEIAAIIQSTWKGILQRRKYLKMKTSAIIIQKYIRTYLAKRNAIRRRKAAETIRKFIRGFISRNGEPNDDNRFFIQCTKINWLERLSKNLPQHILRRQWPPCPRICQQASSHLERMYGAHMSRRYRLALVPERKRQLEMKVLAEKLFKNKKASYPISVTNPFVNNRVVFRTEAQRALFYSQFKGEQAIYSTPVVKYDRHGYKPRERLLRVTKDHLYIIEMKTNSIKIKHCLPVRQLSFVITNGTDRLLLVRVPEDLIKKEKGDIILEIPVLIEALTVIIDTTKDAISLKILDDKSIEHHMKGKNGTIEIQTGSMDGLDKIYKNKSGHLIIAN